MATNCVVSSEKERRASVACQGHETTLRNGITTQDPLPRWVKLLGELAEEARREASEDNCDQCRQSGTVNPSEPQALSRRPDT